SLQYSVYDAKDISAATGATSTVKPAAEQLTVVSMSAANEEKDLAESRRQARQMLQKQQQHRSLNKHGERDLRILYQVGKKDSEEDLPICAPNAVCSKIDLYEIPWIERQCRCPESNRMPNNVIIHHHSHPSVSADTLKYRNYYEREKMMQHKRMLLDDLDHLDQSPDYNDALPYAEVQDNEFPRGSAHMRHSGHRGLKESPPSFIGGCPSSLGVEDGHTIADKTRHYKMCQPVHKHFRDYTWTLTTAAELNVTEQIVHCRCPRNSVTYLTKREPIGDGSPGYRYLFACSPLTRLRCQRKQPCKLFTVRKRQEFLDEVNINSLCQCPKGHRCPSHHTQSGVIAGESFLEDNIQTYSGYCMAND
ncbi:hypothetical protein M5D96_006067, partial [Drosophila gunungcola]